jgi:hypothetical protein
MGSKTIDATELGQAALVGWRQRLADGVAPLVSERTGLGEAQVRAVVGVVFFALSAYYVASTVRRGIDRARG